MRYMVEFECGKEIGKTSLTRVRSASDSIAESFSREKRDNN